MKKRYTTLVLSGMAVFFSSTASFAQFAVNDSITVESMVNDFFDSGILVELSNLTVNGQSPDIVNNQFALFSGGLANGLDMNSGLAMVTGVASYYLDNGSFTFSLTNPVAGDPDMIMITGQNVNDCAIIEFDVTVDADALAFSFLFASIEYAGFTCTQFNDAFAFFISGPGIEGPYSNNAINIATIPNSDVPVGVNTVNGGAPTGGGNAANCLAANPNWQNDTIYFVNNIVNNINQAVSPIQANGFTVTMEAFVEVTFGETYHMKLAICDAADGALDSAVLLEEGSFEGRMLSTRFDSKRPPLKAFPNPATDHLSIQNPCMDCVGTLYTTITDLHGRTVASTSVQNREIIDLPINQLPRGMYIITLNDGQRVLGVSKFVKAEN